MRDLRPAPGVDLRGGPVPLPALVVGVSSVVLGGLVAAVTRPLDWSDGSWVAAYLVLVTGVGQVALAVGQGYLAAEPVPARRTLLQLLLVTGGSTLVVGATLASSPPLVSAGGLVLVVGLVSYATTRRRRGGPGWLHVAYLGVLAVLIVSTPIGLALSWMRA